MSDPIALPIEEGQGVHVPFNWRQQYDPFIDEAWGDVTKTINTEPSLTNQHFTADADINNIVFRYGITDGAPLPEQGIDPTFIADFTEAPDLREVLDRARAANETFQALPANIRTKFKNDPARLWDFINDEDNEEACIKMGLLKRLDPPKKEDPKREAPPPNPPATEKPVSAST